MKAVLLIFTAIISLSACGMEHDATKQYSNVDTDIQPTDTIGTRKTLNHIRFDGWEESDWLDNEYIRTLRKYLDDYNKGIVSNPALDPYKEQIKGKFVVYGITPCLLGGVFLSIIFIDMPDRVFNSWIYSNVDEKKEIVESYEFRFINIEDETTGLTKDDILQAVKEIEDLKLW